MFLVLRALTPHLLSGSSVRPQALPKLPSTMPTSVSPHPKTLPSSILEGSVPFLGLTSLHVLAD